MNIRRKNLREGLAQSGFESAEAIARSHSKSPEGVSIVSCIELPRRPGVIVMVLYNIVLLDEFGIVREIECQRQNAQ